MGQLARAVAELHKIQPEAFRALAAEGLGGEMGGRPVQALPALDQGRVVLCVRLGDAAARLARDAMLGSARKVEVRFVWIDGGEWSVRQREDTVNLVDQPSPPPR